jgi:hypothetical protein
MDASMGSVGILFCKNGDATGREVVVGAAALSLGDVNSGDSSA